MPIGLSRWSECAAGRLIPLVGPVLAFLLHPLGACAGTAEAGSSRVSLQTRETVIARPPLMADPERMAFSPDARHVAFTLLRGRQRTVCVDGVERGTYDRVESLHFSPDGERLAY